MIFQKFAIPVLSFLIVITASGCNDLRSPESTPVPSEYEGYRFISRGDINSDRYRIIKTTYSSGFEDIDSAYYDPMSKQYLVNVNDFNGSSVDTILKLNSHALIYMSDKSPLIPDYVESDIPK